MDFTVNEVGEILQKNLYGKEVKINLEDFLSDLKRYLNPEDDKGRLMTAGYLVPKIIASGVYENNQEITRFIIDFPATRRNLETNVTKESSPIIQNVGCPRTIVSITIEEECIKNIFVFAALNNGEAIDSDTVLFKFPFGNVFPSGSLCTGSVSLSLDDYEGLSITDIVEYILYGTIFNNHLTYDDAESGIPLIVHHSGEDFDDNYLKKPLTTAGALLI